MDKEKLELLKNITTREVKLEDACDILELNEYEVLSLIRSLRLEGINIICQNRDDGIYFFNQGERELEEGNLYHFKTGKNHTFKFVAISDTRFGSKSQQLSILNDIYLKAYEMGFQNVILCGNLTEGLYPLTSIYSESNFLDDSLKQVDYICEYYPQIDGIVTHFITGPKDEKHLQSKKINIGKRIAEARDDMQYLGNSSCNITIDKVKMAISNPKLIKTYTASYRMQQHVDSFRSEDKPQIFLYGGLLQMEEFTYRNVKCISVPSVCATTREMNDKRYSNTIGAWYITVNTDYNGNLKEIKAINSVYYKTNKEDYIKPKVLKLEKRSK